ncbi:MAG: glycosyl transferase family 28 [Chitinophagaceae bacterium]|nr:glycosyl transferase family 28 [Chitinophagaceae bacterium]
MNPAPEVNTPRKPRILVAPLDWGLGHATRCIPVIYELLKHKCEVWLAAEGAQEVLLKQEFPELRFLHLPGYRVKYSRSRSAMIWSMITQTSRIVKAVRMENEWLKKTLSEYVFDAVISDNRYGLHHSSVPCIFMTHQLTIKSPLGKWSERLLQKENYQYINRFTECWIPDLPGTDNLAGVLSHPSKMPDIPARYIGLLSRFENKEIHEINGHILVVLSGPEPQRSILEEKIIKEIAHYGGTATIVRGLPAFANIIPSTNHIRFYNHLPTEELNIEMSKAGYVISRSGYSTVMDLIKLQKKSILIPTPGQTEQEYLGKYLVQKKMAVCIDQKDFSLNTAIRQAREFSYQLSFPGNDYLLSTAVQQLIASLR